jgi:hypothetical protein
VLPLPEKPKLRGKASVALSIISTWLGEGVHVVAVVPADGPTPPPYLEGDGAGRTTGLRLRLTRLGGESRSDGARSAPGVQPGLGAA